MRRDRMLLVDGLVVLWVLAWLVMGLRVSEEVQGLRALSETVTETGGAITQVGEALESLDLPFLGERTDRAASEIADTGRDTRRGGRDARESISNLSTLLGLAVALIPSSPLLIVYVPMRLARIRERRALQRLLRDSAEDPHLERLLAHRALQTLSYRELEGLGGRPWRDLDDRSYTRLADAERHRLGLSRASR